MNKTYVVYKHTSPSGKVYIGITSQPPKRRFDNGRGYSHNEHFRRAINAYGWHNFKSEILGKGLSRDEAVLEEKRLISLYDSTNWDKGYNLMTGGDGIGTHTEATIQKLRILGTGKKWPIERRLSFSRKRKGKTHSEEAKKKMSLIAKGAGNPFYGRHHTEDAKKRIRANMPDRRGGKSSLAVSVCQYDLDGKLISTFPSISDAGRENGIENYYNISACCRGRQKTAYGYVWKYAEERVG